jgi:nucleoside-diphosphate-sugar epimerase
VKILVLGSSGQVGSHLVKHLSSLGHEVIEFDIVNGQDQDIRIFNNKNLLSKIEDCDFIFFLAFDVGGSRYLAKYQHTYEFMDNNISIMKSAFDAIYKHNKKFIFASSQMSNMSYSPYGVLKSVGENYSKILNGRVVKFWNVYGIEHDMSKSHVITDFIIKARDTGVIDMMTDGQEEREFLYAEDCCEALVSVMKNYELIPIEEELCVTSFDSTSIKTIANIIAKHYNASVVPSDKKDSVQLNKKNVASRYILNFWTPKTTIENGIKNVIRGME